ncbi:MAG: toll/interleukin-1 receptor domain-containing protein [Clostridia bacterium]|nr:toll/interleukin-1 receptor domain-containing protein [Clostridia bacterium]
MLDIKKLVEGIGLERDTVFTSISSVDKEIALRLVKRLGQMNFKHWCMYHENGLDRNISGDVYPETISNAISHSCIFIYLMSKHSLVSNEVKKELKQISEAVKSGEAMVIPIFVDDTPNSGIPQEITELIGLNSGTILRRYDESSSEKVMDTICSEILEQYLNIIFDKIGKKFEKQKKSQVFIELMNACVRNKCSANSISDDIKESTEISTDSLEEMHVLSNEMMEYDCNTYSCMVIASNLLGDEEIVNGNKVFRPEKNGVKYFYYTPSGYETECATAFKTVKEFIRKTEESRRQVTSLIRREFSIRNKVVTFFRGLNNMTVQDFMDQYHIEEPIDIENFNKIFEGELAQNYFAYSDEDDVFSVPDEFIAWISGNNSKYTYSTMIEISYNFIDFIKAFVKFLENAKDINNVSYELMKKRYTYLERFRELENWQMGKISLPSSKTKRLVNYLLDHTADSGNRSIKKFPRLANWMQFQYDKSDEIVDIDEKTIQKAFDNLICVPIEDDDTVLQLCYSFAIFLGRTEASGAWYTTGSGFSNNRAESMVTTYAFEKQTNEYKMLLDAWSYLLSVNPKAKEILIQHGSNLLHLLRDNKKRGAHK